MGVFVWALAPFLVCLGAVLLLPCFRWQNVNLAGDLRVAFCVVVFVVCFNRSADFKDLCPCTMF